MYTKEFDIRWSDLDANRHLANSAYINFMSHTRMSFFIDKGITQKELGKLNIGPIIFYEHIYYFKEVFPGKPIKVSVEVTGLSQDGSLFEFAQNFYDTAGKNIAHCEMMGAWMDLKERKIIAFPEELKHALEGFPKAKNFRILTKADTRKHNKRPVNLK